MKQTPKDPQILNIRSCGLPAVNVAFIAETTTKECNDLNFIGHYIIFSRTHLQEPCLYTTLNLKYSH